MSVFRRLSVRAILALASVIALSWGIFHFRVLAANVRASWTYDYAPEPACSATRSTNCIDHFEVLDITTRNFALLASAPNPSPANGKVEDISITFKYGPPFGQRTISVIAIGKDTEGKRVMSNPYAACGTASIRPGSAVSTILK